MKSSDRLPLPTVNARAAVLSFVRAYLARHDDSPSLGEIADGLGSTKPRVLRILSGLERDGELIRLPGAARCKRRILLPEQQSRALALLRQLGWEINPGSKLVQAPDRTSEVPFCRR